MQFQNCFSRYESELFKLLFICVRCSDSVKIPYLILDPCEYRDVSHLYPQKLLELKERLNYYRSTALPIVYPLISPKADPKNFNSFWTPWETLTDKSEYYASKRACSKVQAKQVQLGLHPMTFSNHTF